MPELLKKLNLGCGKNKYCGLKSTVFENPEKFVQQISGTQEMLSAFLRELSKILSFICKLKFAVF